jgi:hypothetical protein
MKKPISLLVCLGWSVSCALAGLPQPMFIYYGQALDGFGIPYHENAEVILLRGGIEVARHEIRGSLSPGVNFALYAHLDEGQEAANYSSRSVNTGDPISIIVRDAYGQKTILEQSALPPVGQPGGQIGIRVTAAVDADSDLLPDPWEEEMIHWSGGTLKAIHEVHPADDFDGDGQINRDEYGAGTFAFLDYDFFYAEKMQITPNDRMAITFWGVSGKVYSVQYKTDLSRAAWIDAPVATSDATEFSNGSAEGKNAWLTMFIPRNGDTCVYRLRVD